MRPFSELSAAGQFRRLRVLAERALRDHYGFSPGEYRLRPLRHGENTTWKLESAGLEATVRVHRSGYHSPERIRGELEWLCALDDESEVVVPRPVATTDGRWVVEESVDGVPEPRAVSVLTWIDGRVRSRGQLGPTVQAMGRAAARLHSHARSWPRAHDEDFDRLTWDLAALLDHHPGGGAVSELIESQPAAIAQRLEAWRERLREQLEPWASQQTLILVHADLHFWNVLRTPCGELAVIDFDDCGWSWPALDLSVTLQYIRESPELADRFLCAYDNGGGSIDAETHDVFAVLADALDFSDIVWLYHRRDNPRYRPALKAVLESID